MNKVKLNTYQNPEFDRGASKLRELLWMICPGVHAHSHAVLSVASVAVTDLEAYTIYQGNPAQVVKTRVIN